MSLLTNVPRGTFTRVQAGSKPAYMDQYCALNKLNLPCLTDQKALFPDAKVFHPMLINNSFYKLFKLTLKAFGKQGVALSFHAVILHNKIRYTLKLNYIGV